VASDIVGGARRILIYGVTGSGKSTLAARLSAITGIPWHSVDDLTWQPGWVAVSAEEQRRRVHAICEGAEWILDTAYATWLDEALGRAELIIALDYPRWSSLQRLVRRTLLNVISGRLICNGNRETLRTTVSRDSIIVWHFRSFRHKRERIRQWLSDPPVPAVWRHSSARQTRQWLLAAAGRQG